MRTWLKNSRSTEKEAEIGTDTHTEKETNFSRSEKLAKIFGETIKVRKQREILEAREIKEKVEKETKKEKIAELRKKFENTEEPVAENKKRKKDVIGNEKKIETCKRIEKRKGWGIDVKENNVTVDIKEATKDKNEELKGPKIIKPSNGGIKVLKTDLKTDKIKITNETFVATTLSFAGLPRKVGESDLGTAPSPSLGRNDFGRRVDEDRLGPNECQRVCGISAVLPQ